MAVRATDLFPNSSRPDMRFENSNVIRGLFLFVSLIANGFFLRAVVVLVPAVSPVYHLRLKLDSGRGRKAHPVRLAGGALEF